MKNTRLPNATLVSDLDAELARRERGPARAFFERVGQRGVFVSVVTLEEPYERRGQEAPRELASRSPVLGRHMGDAMRCGLLQARSATSAAGE